MAFPDDSKMNTDYVITVTPASAGSPEHPQPHPDQQQQHPQALDFDLFDEEDEIEPMINTQVDQLKPQAYIFPMVHQNHSANSTPSDSRSICETPDSDPWSIPELRTAGPQWNELTTKDKIKHTGWIAVKISALVALLYFFICSLDLLSTAFRLLGSRAVGRFFSDNQLLHNPVVGLMIGVLVTVLVQSSSTSTSIVVTMVASHIIEVRQAIPIVMGANIGTSVTNTIVSLMQSADRNEFRRAFAAATVHDMFNWLTVIVLLPVESSTHYLEKLTTMLVQDGSVHQDKSANREFLSKLTKPFTKKIIQIDKKLLERIASGNTTNSTDRLIIRCCEEDICRSDCHDSLFAWFGFSDTTTGIILLSLSILVLCSCLMLLVKVLNSMLTGQIAKIIKRTMNREYVFPYSLIADYLAILAGCILTILVQSSSIFTSALTPLAGIGVISLERMYPLTLGSNIGTTTTGLLAALAADSNRIRDTMQLALCHLFFNITGILLFYPIPFMRFPIPLARMLGNITATYRWFSIFYLVSMFFLLPLIVFSLSTLGTAAMVAIGGPVLLLLATVIAINLIQTYHSSWLPLWLQNWHFLPLWLRSLDPLDRIITKVSEKFGCLNCCATSSAMQHMPMSRGKDRSGLGHHSATHQSQLHILGSMYRSNSESQFQDMFQQRRRTPSVNEKIKKVMFKLAKASHTNLPGMSAGSHRPEAAENEAYEWPQFNSHTVHNCTDVHRYYPASPFMTMAKPTNSPSSDPTEANQSNEKVPLTNNTVL